jgi:glucokinase
MAEALALGIDIGGTNTAWGIVTQTGKIIESGSLNTTGHGAIENYIAAIKTAVEPAMNRHGKELFLGVGVGAPSANYLTSEIVYAPNMPWHGIIPLGALLQQSLGLKCYVNNDANAATIGEMIYGAAKGMKNFILVTLGTGLGSGFVANGQMIYGHDGLAGELGHVIAVRDGRKCGCGRNGCLETYASATGIVKTVEEWLINRQDDSLLRSQIGAITSKTIHEAALKSDALALEAFNYTARILGQTLADAVAITSPQAIILFGGLAHAGKLLLTPVKTYMEENMLMIYKNKVAILPSALHGADAAILGASSMVWHHNP